MCTQTLPHELTVFGSAPHMHQVGDEIWTTQWRNGTKIAEWGRVEYWAFEHQQGELVNFTIKPGDRFNTHCVYNTKNKGEVTPFGISSSEEMCIHFLSYYPRVIGFDNCGYFPYNFSVCGNSLIRYPNPTNRDPPGAAERTFGVDGSKCQAVPSEPSSAMQILPIFYVLVIFVLGCVL